MFICLFKCFGMERNWSAFSSMEMETISSQKMLCSFIQTETNSIGNYFILDCRYWWHGKGIQHVSRNHACQWLSCATSQPKMEIHRYNDMWSFYGLRTWGIKFTTVFPRLKWFIVSDLLLFSSFFQSFQTAADKDEREGTDDFIAIYRRNSFVGFSWLASLSLVFDGI